VANAVHLETRCNGEHHDGCEAACLIFWKTIWLEPLSAQDSSEARLRDGTGETAEVANAAGIRESELRSCARHSGADGRQEVYVCQATRLPYATTHLSWWDVRQYVEDYTSGNVGFRRIVSGFAFALYSAVLNAGVGLGPALRSVYNRLRPLWRGSMYPGMAGTIPPGQTTPTDSLNLQPGEWVRVKSHGEILATVSVDGKNRGLSWDEEMVPYCGGTFRVLRRVTRIVNEKTGFMQEMKNPCIILDSVICTGRYSKRRKFCPRSIYPYWREIWLERVPGPAPTSAIPECTSAPR